MGAAKPTLQTEDIQQLEDQTEQWHDGFERMYQSVKLSYAQLSKRKTSVQDPRLKCRPLEAIGDSWIRHGEEIAENSPKLGMHSTTTTARQRMLTCVCVCVS